MSIILFTFTFTSKTYNSGELVETPAQYHQINILFNIIKILNKILVRVQKLRLDSIIESKSLNKVLESKSYSQCLKMSLKRSVH